MKDLHDPEAEAIILGALLDSPTERHSLFEILDVEDFWDTKVRLAFTVIHELHERGEPVLVRRVAELAAVRGDGLSVDSLVMARASAVPTGRYTARLLELSERRRIQAHAHAAASLAYDEDVDPWSSWEDLHDRITLARMAAASDGFGVVPASIYRTDELIPIRWCIPGLMEYLTRTVLIGPSGYGKSMALRQIGLNLSQGLHPFEEGVTIEPRRVLHVELENGRDLVERRLQFVRQEIQRWLNLKQVPVDWSRYRSLPLQRNINLRARIDQRALLGELTNFRPDLLIIGPIYRAFVGKAGDMGGEGAASEVQDFLDDTLARFEIAQLWEAHSPKSDPLTIRGSAAWTNWCDYGFAMVPQGESGHSWVVPIRGPRGDGHWPAALERDLPGQYPWSAVARRSVKPETEEEGQWR